MTPRTAVTRLLVVTDLDGSLLDEQTYSYEAARPALRALVRRGVGLVLASSKTRAEMETLAQGLGQQPPLIVENGGAVLTPRGDGAYDALARGVDRPTLVQALAEIAREAAARLRGFSSLTVHELSGLTGLAPEAARLALDRQYDEPFLLDDEAKVAPVTAAAEKRLLRVTRAGRFFHLTGASDKGRALRDLIAYFARKGRRYLTLGLGDSANDLSFLRVVSRPIVVPRPDGRIDADLQRGLPRAERAPAPGPSGWNAAVLTVLQGGRLPPVTGDPA